MPESFGENIRIDVEDLGRAMDQLGGQGDVNVIDINDFEKIVQIEDKNVMNIGALTDKMAGGIAEIKVKSN